jgi:NifU-like protein involved in Fe-S cluster formation
VSAFLETGAALQGIWRDFEIFAPVRDHPSRHGCVLLAFEALDAALRGDGSEQA